MINEENIQRIKGKIWVNWYIKGNQLKKTSRKVTLGKQSQYSGKHDKQVN